MSFVSCTTSHVGLCSFLESIEHGFIMALIHTGTPNSDFGWESVGVMIWT